MSPLLTTYPTADTAGHACPAIVEAIEPRATPAMKAALSRLETWLRTPFSLVDGETGEAIQLAGDHRRLDWTTRGELCREVARRQRVEAIDESGPCLLLAIPVPSLGEAGGVAVGAFLTRPADERDAPRVAEFLGLTRAAAIDWISRQTPADAEMLERFATLAFEKLSGEEQIEQLENEVEKLSGHLGATFEEISLLYRLTHNLKLSADDEELGQRALEWLAEVVPAEAFALQLNGSGPSDSLATGTRTEPVLLKFGNCELTSQDFGLLVRELALQPTSRPLVVNHIQGETFGQWFPGMRQIVIVPIAEGERLFGWLAIFNHSLGHEFGTAEASLLSSVGTMLGIHSANIDLYRQQAELLAGVVKAMTSAIDAKDPYTCGHSDRVARVAVRLAQELGCDSETLNTIYFSGLLHDIGKIGINEEVLRKPGKLTAEEFEHIKQHVIIGHRILADLRNMSQMLPVVLHHHEAWDGSGYPHRLAGTDIPYLARIVAVADSYDAMASDRPYRPGMEDDKLDDIIRSGAGKQWDPDVVAAFFRVRDDVRAISGRGSPPPVRQPT